MHCLLEEYDLKSLTHSYQGLKSWYYKMSGLIIHFSSKIWTKRLFLPFFCEGCAPYMHQRHLLSCSLVFKLRYYIFSFLVRNAWCYTKNVFYVVPSELRAKENSWFINSLETSAGGLQDKLISDKLIDAMHCLLEEYDLKSLTHSCQGLKSWYQYWM